MNKQTIAILIGITHVLSLITIGSAIVVELHILPDLDQYQYFFSRSTSMTPWERVCVLLGTVTNGGLSLVIAFNLSRRWTTGKTDNNSCPFTILENIYSGHWTDSGGQKHKAARSILVYAVLIFLGHGLLVGISISFLAST